MEDAIIPSYLIRIWSLPIRAWPEYVAQSYCSSNFSQEYVLSDKAFSIENMVLFEADTYTAYFFISHIFGC